MKVSTNMLEHVVRQWTTKYYNREMYKCRKCTRMAQMITLNEPNNKGYMNFQSYTDMKRLAQDREQ